MAKTRTEIQAKYDAANRTAFSFKLHNTNDAEIIDKLKSVPSIQGYIKQLIREDLERTEPGHKRKMTLDELYTFLQGQTDDFDDSMYELLNALTNKHLNG